MTRQYDENFVIKRIRGEEAALNKVVERAIQSWKAIQSTSPEDQYPLVDSVALSLHSFYSGIERLFELVARHIDHYLPDGKAWHLELLQQMTQAFSDVRPAVISSDHIAALDELRRFRHLVRNAYTVDLKPERMETLMQSLSSLWLGLRAELLAFAEYLEALTEST